MNKNIFKTIYKCIAWSIFILSLILLSAYIIAYCNNYLYENVLFVESIVLIMVGLFASISGNPLGLSFQTAEQNSSQFKALETLKITEMEKEKTKGLDNLNIISSISTVSLVFSGLLGVIASYLI